MVSVKLGVSPEAGVAQLVEQLIRNQQVVRSTRIAGSIRFNHLQALKAGSVAIAEFERARIQERVRAGLARAKAQGKRLGRPAVDVPVDLLITVAGLKHVDAAQHLGVSTSTIRRWRRVEKTIAAAA